MAKVTSIISFEALITFQESPKLATKCVGGGRGVGRGGGGNVLRTFHRGPGQYSW